MSEHYRVGPGKCVCGFDAYKVNGIMVDYHEEILRHLRVAPKAKPHIAAVSEGEELELPRGCERICLEAHPSMPFWMAWFYQSEYGVDGHRWQRIEDQARATHALSLAVESIPEVRDIAIRFHCYLKYGGCWQAWGVGDDVDTPPGSGTTPIEAIRAAVAAALGEDNT